MTLPDLCPHHLFVSTAIHRQRYRVRCNHLLLPRGERQKPCFEITCTPHIFNHRIYGVCVRRWEVPLQNCRSCPPLKPGSSHTGRRPSMFLALGIRLLSQNSDTDHPQVERSPNSTDLRGKIWSPICHIGSADLEPPPRTQSHRWNWRLRYLP